MTPWGNGKENKKEKKEKKRKRNLYAPPTSRITCKGSLRRFQHHQVRWNFNTKGSHACCQRAATSFTRCRVQCMHQLVCHCLLTSVPVIYLYLKLVHQTLIVLSQYH